MPSAAWILRQPRESGRAVDEEAVIRLVDIKSVPLRDVVGIFLEQVIVQGVERRVTARIEKRYRHLLAGKGRVGDGPLPLYAALEASVLISG